MLTAYSTLHGTRVTVMMPRPRVSDEELGKRDDDHKLRIKPNRGPQWYSPRGPWRRRRVAAGILFLLAVYLFIHNLPEGVKRPSSRPHYVHDGPKFGGSGDAATSLRRPPPNHPPPAPALSKPANAAETRKPSEDYWFDGPIRFESLASSLFKISRTGGSLNVNKNVLFAASSLKSASLLLPMACEMAAWGRNDVHFAFLGRDIIPMQAIREINGIGEDCGVWFHDGRPDYGPESTDYRMEVSSSAALGHITNYMHEQAIIVDNSEHENQYFLKAMDKKSRALQRTLILLPSRADQSLRWITRLDSAALSAYNKVDVSIIVHSQPSSAGSLVRLLQSLSKADYSGTTIPRLSIDLPHDVDDAVAGYLEDHFRWPPSATADSDSRQFNLHRRVSSGSISPEEKSVRFLEGFWPANRHLSHVLVLSPQVELSPLFYYYLRFHILEYKYSLAAADKKLGHDNILGMSLSLPTTFLNDSTPFTPPTPETSKPSEEESSGTSFLRGSPSSDAVLYFGDKWTELLDFTSQSLASAKKLPKSISTTYPAWLEYVLTFSRLRGLAMIYPPSTGSAIAVVHNDLYSAPEEYSRSLSDPGMEVESDDFTADPLTHLSLEHNEVPPASGNLLALMDEALLPPLKSMPMLSWDGEEVDSDTMLAQAESFSAEFRSQIGGCTDPVTAKSRLLDQDIGALFCDGASNERPADSAGEDEADVVIPERMPVVEPIPDHEKAQQGGGEVGGVADNWVEEQAKKNLEYNMKKYEKGTAEAKAEDATVPETKPVVAEPIPDHEKAQQADIEVGSERDDWVQEQAKKNLEYNIKKYSSSGGQPASDPAAQEAPEALPSPQEVNAAIPERKPVIVEPIPDHEKAKQGEGGPVGEVADNWVEEQAKKNLEYNIRKYSG